MIVDGHCHGHGHCYGLLYVVVMVIVMVMVIFVHGHCYGHCDDCCYVVVLVIVVVMVCDDDPNDNVNTVTMSKVKSTHRTCEANVEFETGLCARGSMCCRRQVWYDWPHLCSCTRKAVPVNT